MTAYLNCDEIVKIVDLYQHDEKFFIFLEFMEGGSLNKVVSQKKRDYSEDFCRYTLFKVARGLNRMHSENVLHRDIKSDNVLINAAGDIKLADFGFAIFLSQQ